MPTREVETFFLVVRLTANLSDGNRPFGNEDKGSEVDAGVVTYDLIEGLEPFTYTDNVDALMSMGDA